MASRLLTVPDGLAGERIDIALTRMLGLSRSRAVDIISLGAVTLDGSAAMKSDRLLAGSVIEIDTEVGLEPVAMQIDTEPVPGLHVLYDDNDLIVVDKPVGVAAHPSPGWTGPTVVGGLIGTRIAKRLGTGGTLTTVFAVLIFVVAAYMLWKSAAAFL